MLEILKIEVIMLEMLKIEAIMLEILTLYVFPSFFFFSSLQTYAVTQVAWTLQAFFPFI